MRRSLYNVILRIASDCRYTESRYTERRNAERRRTFVMPLALNISILLQANKLECLTSLTFAIVLLHNKTMVLAFLTNIRLDWKSI